MARAELLLYHTQQFREDILIESAHYCFLEEAYRGIDAEKAAIDCAWRDDMFIRHPQHSSTHQYNRGWNYWPDAPG